MNQNTQLRNYLLKGKRITQPIAMQKMLIGRLASRVNNLENMGIKISRRMIPYERADGKVVSIAQYWIDEKQILKLKKQK
jgi:hypothetical protein